MTAPKNVFVRRETPDGRPPAIIKVTEVDESYAYTASLTEPGKSYPIPIADYDRNFVATWRPAEEADLASLGEPDKSFRLPGNAPISWGGEAPEFEQQKAGRKR